jgi:nitric oxide reductase NorD protein
MSLAARTASALAELVALARQRPGLSGGLAAALARHERDEAEVWAQAALRLAYVNAGPGALLGVFRVASATPPGAGALRRLAAGVAAAADLCGLAGAVATRAAVEARIGLAARLESGDAAWWRGLLALAREAPDLIAVAASASAPILDACGAEGFAAFVGAALRAAPDAARRAAFLSLADPEARRTLDRLAGRAAFSVEQKRLEIFAAALWGVATPLRPLFGAPGAPAPRRASVAGGVIRIPETFPDVEPDPALFRAAVAHASAHLVFGAARREIGSLKPAQVALIGLIEDARVEALAMRRFPGLARLWAPFHTATPSVFRAAPALFARLAHALFDPSYEDADGFVAKGRDLFAAEPDLGDPDLSRRIGGLLGNDVGQMRIPFNPKAFEIEPVYRDDNLGLWLLPPPPPDQPAEALDTPINAARPKPGQGGEGDGEGAGRARPAEAEQGVVVAHYPEWDRKAQQERPDWTTVREMAPTLAPTHRLEEALARDPGFLTRIDRLVRAAKVGRPMRLKRQPFGDDLDLDAAIDAVQSLRIGETPDERLHMRRVLRRRDLAVSVLIDVSESTRDPAGVGACVLDVEKHAVAALARAMSGLGDVFALSAFASVGREDVRIVRVKDFAEPFDDVALRRLAGLTPGFSTRLGAALRHAGAELKPRAAERKLVLALTDGAPSDIDVSDPADLVEDARRAALALKAQGIDVFGLTLDPNGDGEGAAVFGRNHLPVRRISDLPARLADLYFRLARR